MQAFHEPEIYDGTVTLKRAATGRRGTQLQLVETDPE
jgi:hypothetical protein